MFHLNNETFSYLYMFGRIWNLYHPNMSVTKTKYFNDKILLKKFTVLYLFYGFLSFKISFVFYALLIKRVYIY